MAAKRLCALASASVLIALGLVAVVLAELPAEEAARPPRAAFTRDDSLDEATPQPAGLQDRTPIRLEPEPMAPGTGVMIPQLLLTGPAALPMPRKPDPRTGGYDAILGEFDHLSPASVQR